MRYAAMNQGADDLAAYDGFRHLSSHGYKRILCLGGEADLYTVREQSFARAARFRHLARDYELLSETLAAFHHFAFVCLMLSKICKLLYWSY